MLLLAGLLPLAFPGSLLSGRSAQELRSVEGRYQAQLVQDKALTVAAPVMGEDSHDVLAACQEIN